ncbi:MAG TPA: phage integrase N-terminal SAM-like domain-containing protein [Chloroflexota bacterium]|nr:phage integrase N-terminal SAM-like domain-containing protein [Chloroflexota bacterium]
MSDNLQQTLIPESELPPAVGPTAPPVTADASIQAALGAFEQHMRDEGFALNTSKAFASDVRLLGKYLGIGQPIGQIGTKDLNDFLNWLLYERGVPCSPKSYARRVTTLKVFFAWLKECGALLENPATAVIQHSVRSPLPTLPTETDIENALAVSQRLRQGEGLHSGAGERKPDARPHLLLTLLLKTGIKKGEAMTIVPNHIDRSNPDEPMLFVRYANPRLRYKERRLPLDPEWLDVLDEYLPQYNPPDTLFTCTARNLEYVLSDVGTEAGLAQGMLSFENLRWFSALQDLKTGEEPDEIRQKLGLSKITWRETKTKLEQLAKAGTS